MPLGASRLAFLAKTTAAAPTGSSLFTDYGSTTTKAVSDSNYTFGTGDFTIECWTYLTEDVNGYPFAHGTSFNDGSNVRLLYVASTNKWQLRLGSSNYDPNTTLSLNTWYHVALVRSSSTVNFYLDGTKDTTIGTSGDVTFSNNLAARPMALGNLSYANITPFSGNIDEFRISDTARYTSNFTPSTSAFTDDSDTLTLLHCEDDGGGNMDDDISVRGSGGIDYTLSGDASFDTTVFKF